MYFALRRTLAAPLLLLAASLLITPAVHAQATLATSTFNTDDDGWTVVDLPASGGLTYPIQQDGGPFTPTYDSSGGNPGGYISYTDADSNSYYWYAPAKFLGDKSTAYNGTLSFDMNDTDAGGGVNPSSDGLILVGSNGVTLTTMLSVPSATAFTHYTVSLSPAGFTNLASGKPASAADMQSVLGSLQNLYILGDFEEGTDTSSLDNVILTAAPPPVTLSSLALTPTSVTAGQTSSGKVTLSSVAPSGGATITLKSSDTSSATVPSSVSIAAGNKTQTFTITTKSVTGTKTVTITAAVGSSTKTATLTIAPVVTSTLSSLVLTPTSVTGGTSGSGKVTLSSAAPSGGATVTLKSSNTAVATVPASETIAAGDKTYVFAITTKAVTSTQTVTITATIGSSTKTATLTVNAPPVTVKSLSLSPSTVVGGKTTTGTVTLTGAAPSGGAAVTLSINGSTAGTVSVPAGSTTATFTILTFPVSAKTTATIGAAYGGTTKTAMLTITPASSSAHASTATRTGGPVCTLIIP